MRKVVLLVLAAAVLLSLTGCAESAELLDSIVSSLSQENTGGEQTEIMGQENEKIEHQVGGETKYESGSAWVPSPDSAPVEKETLAYSGFWSTTKTMSTGDPNIDVLLPYQTFYLMLFKNGTALRYGNRYLDVGVWECQGDQIQIEIEYNFYDFPGDSWTQVEGDERMLLSYDETSDALLQMSAENGMGAPMSEWESKIKFYSVNYPEAFEALRQAVLGLKECFPEYDSSPLEKEANGF